MPGKPRAPTRRSPPALERDGSGRLTASAGAGRVPGVFALPLPA